MLYSTFDDESTLGAGNDLSRHVMMICAWANVDPDPCPHVASLGPNESTKWYHSEIITVFTSDSSQLDFLKRNAFILIQILSNIVDKDSIDNMSS